MQVAILTVGDEVLAGETTNTNASWLATELTDRGVTVARILTVPDDEAVIAEWVREFSESFDAVVVTGGIGGTHDDVTVEGHQHIDILGEFLATPGAAGTSGGIRRTAALPGQAG